MSRMGGLLDSNVSENQRLHELLIADTAWLRRVAAGLVADPNDADDVAQAALAAAIERRPSTAIPLRGWLASVARNLAFRIRRDAARRRERERAAADREAVPPAEELWSRAAVAREIVDAIGALEEPYRTAILLRYLEDRRPREIARRLGVPVRTV